MRIRPLASTFLAVSAVSSLAFAQAAAPAAAPTSTTTPAIPGVVAAGTVVEVIRAGFTGTEGPIGLPDGHLIFTETQANRITRIDKDTGATSTFLENTNGSNGLGFDAKGRLISVQTVPGRTRIGVIHPATAVVTLTDAFEGRPYGRPNDLVVSKTGAIYFSEPGPNATPGEPAPATPPMAPAVYHVSASGAVARVAEGIERPNGVMLSADEQTLYVNNTNGEHLLAFDVQADGRLVNRRNFARYAKVSKTPAGVFNSGADGLAIDAEGRVYAATAAGIEVFSRQGAALGVIPVALAPQNLAFAGSDKKTLFIVGRGAAFKVRVLTAGYAGRAK